MNAPVTLATLRDRGLVRDVRGDASVVLTGLSQDSRRIEQGDAFALLDASTSYVAEAVRRGAVAVVGPEALAIESPSAAFVLEPRVAMAQIANVIYGAPTEALVTIGITGTNGKTTTTWIVDEVLTTLGQRPALLGTVEARGPGYRDASQLTTPEADTIARFARRMKDAGATHLVMEVSSHGLALSRVEGVHFEVAAFTNLTQDHLDFHGTMEAYLEAKSRLFFAFAPPSCVINVDDPVGENLAIRLAAERPEARVFRVSSKGAQADISLRVASPSRNGMSILADTPMGPLAIETPMVGNHNIDNLLLAAACAMAAIQPPPSLSDLGSALGSARGAPGRLERVADSRDVAIFVDYAHSPDALDKALIALRPLTPGRLVCVFGCGGDRDRDKRPLMGAVAGRRADLTVITSDNPRTEAPDAIISEIEPGCAALQPRVTDITPTATGYAVCVERRQAIRAAIAAAQPGDTVLIAGKGHETYQISGSERVHFDDREEARIASAQAGA